MSGSRRYGIHNRIQHSYKNYQILAFLTMWIELDGIMLSKRSHREKDKCYMISLIWNIKKTKEQTNYIRTDTKLLTGELRLLEGES